MGSTPFTTTILLLDNEQLWCNVITMKHCITAKPKKLKAKWSVEAEQNLEFWSIDAKQNLDSWYCGEDFSREYLKHLKELSSPLNDFGNKDDANKYWKMPERGKKT
jgi:hypothetical protein